eukprot:gene9708-biopygen2521
MPSNPRFWQAQLAIVNKGFPFLHQLLLYCKKVGHDKATCKQGRLRNDHGMTAPSPHSPGFHVQVYGSGGGRAHTRDEDFLHEGRGLLARYVLSRNVL